MLGWKKLRDELQIIWEDFGVETKKTLFLNHLYENEYIPSKQTSRDPTNRSHVGTDGHFLPQKCLENSANLGLELVADQAVNIPCSPTL